jgi:hypothetical protein
MGYDNLQERINFTADPWTPVLEPGTNRIDLVHDHQPDYADITEEQPVLPEPIKKTTEDLIAEECDAIKELLISKNRRYGDSAIKRGAIYDISPVVAIKARINDKLSRLKNLQSDDSEDVIKDLIGYFILLRIAEKQ